MDRIVDSVNYRKRSVAEKIPSRLDTTTSKIVIMKVAIDGMHCEACVKRVRKAIEKVGGARVESVEVGSAAVAVGPAGETAVLEAIRQAGYEARKTG